MWKYVTIKTKLVSSFVRKGGQWKKCSGVIIGLHSRHSKSGHANWPRPRRGLLFPLPQQLTDRVVLNPVKSNNIIPELKTMWGHTWNYYIARTSHFVKRKKSVSQFIQRPLVGSYVDTQRPLQVDAGTPVCQLWTLEPEVFPAQTIRSCPYMYV